MPNIKIPDYELAGPLDDANIVEVVQPLAGGIRQEKKTLLSTAKTYYQGTIPTDISNIADGTTPITPDINGGTVDGITSLTVSNDVDLGNVDVRAKSFTSDVPIGTAPLVVTSTTKVANLNADLLDDLNTGNASGNIPINNGTVNTNLNADLLDGKHAPSGAIVGISDTQTLTNKTLTSPIINTPDINGGTVDNITSLTVSNNIDIGNFDLRAKALQSDVPTGTPPLTVSSTTKVNNLNADLLDGATLSTDGTLSGNSDTDIPTEKAVKTYVDGSGLGTNLGWVAGTTSGPTVTSSTGTNATMPSASASASGAVTTGSQTFAGIKTFSSIPIVPSNPIADGDTGAVQGNNVYDYINTTVMPVGSTYIQFPGNSDPSTLGLIGTWSNISTSFAGDFFRVEGGNASAFNSGQQSDAMQRITGNILNRFFTVDIGATGPNADGVFSDITSSNSDTANRVAKAGRGIDSILFDSANSTSPNAAKTDDVETRVVNQTIRVWKRTA